MFEGKRKTERERLIGTQNGMKMKMEMTNGLRAREEETCKRTGKGEHKIEHRGLREHHHHHNHFITQKHTFRVGTPLNK